MAPNLALVRCAGCGAPLHPRRDSCSSCGALARRSSLHASARTTLEHLEDAGVDRAYVIDSERSLARATRVGLATAMVLAAPCVAGIVAASWALVRAQPEVAALAIGLGLGLAYIAASFVDDLLPGRFWRPRAGAASVPAGRCRGCGAPTTLEPKRPVCGCCGAGLFAGPPVQDLVRDVAREARAHADLREQLLEAHPLGVRRIASRAVLVTGAALATLIALLGLVATIARVW